MVTHITDEYYATLDLDELTLYLLERCISLEQVQCFNS